MYVTGVVLLGEIEEGTGLRLGGLGVVSARAGGFGVVKVGKDGGGMREGGRERGVPVRGLAEGGEERIGTERLTGIIETGWLSLVDFEIVARGGVAGADFALI